MANPESFKQACPSCEAAVTIKAPSLIGKKVECPRCKYRFVVEDPAKAKKAAAKSKAPPPEEEEGILDAEEDPVPAKGKGGKAAKKRDDDEDSDEPKAKKKKKKAAGGNTKVLIGVGLAVVGVIVLGVAAYFIFMGGEDTSKKTVAKGKSTSTPPASKDPDVTPPDPDDKPSPPPKGKKGADKGKGTNTPIPPKKGGLAGPENTNFLPPSSEEVVHSRFKDILDSPIGRSLADPKTGLPDAVFKEKLGFSLLAVDDCLVAQSNSENWKFGVVHITQPVTDWRTLIQGMGLTDWTENPTKQHKCYVVQRNIPWVEALINLASMGNISDDNDSSAKPKKSVLLFHLRDAQTLIFADPKPMADYLCADGKFPVSQAAAKKGKASGSYLTVSPDLRETLLHLSPSGQQILLNHASSFKSLLEKQGAKDVAKMLLGSKGPGDIAPAVIAMADRVTCIGNTISLPNRTTLQLLSSIFCAAESDSTQLHKDIVAKGGPQAAQLSARNVDFGLELMLNGPVLDLFRNVIQGEALSALAGAELATGSDFQFQLAKAGKELGEKGVTDRKVQPKHFPPGVFSKALPILGTSRDPSEGISWMSTLLPFLGRDTETLYRQINFGISWRDEQNSAIATAMIPQFLDPSFPASSRKVTYPGLTLRPAATHFVGIAGIGPDAIEARAGDPKMVGKLGVFGYNRSTSLAAIEKGRGLSNTLLMIRVPFDGPAGVTPWMAGGGSTIRSVPEKNSLAPFLSKNAKGDAETFALMADGSVRILKKGMSDEAFKAICTVDGPKPADFKFDEDFPPLAKPKPEPTPPPLKGDPVPPPPPTTAGQPIGATPAPAPKPSGGGKPVDDKKVALPPGWETYTHDEGGFSIAMPAGAAMIADPTKMPLVDGASKGFKAETTGPRYGYHAVVESLTAAAMQMSKEELFDALKVEFAKTIGNAPLKSNEISLASNPGREFTAVLPSPKGDVTFSVRVFNVGDRLYSVVLYTPGVAPDSPEYVAFLNSFRLTKGK